MTEDLCNRCAKCCFIVTDLRSKEDKTILKQCKFLIKENNEFSCKVYESRLGRILSRRSSSTIICKMYNSLHTEIKDCPMNEGNKPLIEVELKGDYALANWSS